VSGHAMSAQGPIKGLMLFSIIGGNATVPHLGNRDIPTIPRRIENNLESTRFHPSLLWTVCI
jgi:hypothetical protein